MSQLTYRGEDTYHPQLGVLTDGQIITGLSDEQAAVYVAGGLLTDESADKEAVSPAQDRED